MAQQQPPAAKSPPSPPAEAPKPPAATDQVAVVKPPAAPALPSSSSAPASSKAFRDCERCPEMVNLPGGSFMMGSNDDASEKPVHEVTIGAFALGRYPVTIGEWRQCVADKACSYEPTGDDNLPVYNVSWTDTQQYITWLAKLTKQQYRLPSEAEWEYAARARTTTRFWWGDQPPNGRAACKGCGTDANASQPIKIGSFAPNLMGLSDMTGSVSQWVADCWVRDYQGAPRNGAPRTLPNCRQYVLRGGSWKNEATYLRSASRDSYDKGVRYLAHGFRVARQKGD
jgi:formylglycine-generating enzyme required for sulfatase activity